MWVADYLHNHPDRGRRHLDLDDGEVVKINSCVRNEFSPAIIELNVFIIVREAKRCPSDDSTIVQFNKGVPSLRDYVGIEAPRRDFLGKVMKIYQRSELTNYPPSATLLR